MTIRFTVPGKPMGKQRPRFNGRYKTPYTPDATVAYEELTRFRYKEASYGLPMFQGGVYVEIIAYFPVPQGYSKQKHKDCYAGRVRPTGKPDADNIAKIVCDALNGYAWKDDSCVVDLHVIKRYVPSENGSAHVDVFIGDLGVAE